MKSLVTSPTVYKSPLKENTTLEIFNNDTLIFSNSGKWLMPLFALEDFLKTYDGDKSVLCAHDTAIGKAAAVLMIRLGIKYIHANLASRLAENYINELNSNSNDESAQISFSYDSIVDRLLCATENELENLNNIDEMYSSLRLRSKLVQGVEVKITNLHSDFGSLENINLTLPAGGRLMVTGENGTGKTTLLRLIAGIYKSPKGTILIDGKNPNELPKYTIGYIPQQTDDVQFSLSVKEIVSLGLPPKTKDKNEIIKKALTRTSSLSLIDRSFSTLSGGEKQKVSMARCLAQNAKLLLLDEPTAALDSENRKMVTDILHSLTVTEIPTIIVVTHDKELSELNGWTKLKLGGNK